MSSGQPIIKQIAWVSVPIQIVIMILFMAVFSFAQMDEPILLGALTYLLVVILVRRFVLREHRRGIAFFKRKQYTEAIDHFKESYDFFTKHKWVDRYRFVTTFSSSRISYREMALLDMAFCYAQTGNGDKSKEYYLQTLNEFPDSEIAKASLKMIESIEQSKTI